jgi:hypothetical protein
MKLDFETLKKTFEDPFNGDHARTLRKNMAEGISKASEYHTQMVRTGVDTMKKMQDWWFQGVDWYIDSHQKMTSFLNERMTEQDKK